MQQSGHLCRIGLVGRRGGDRVDQPAIGVHADVRLHPNVPLIALLRLMHLGNASALGILRRTGRCNDRRAAGVAKLYGVPAMR